MYEKTVWKARQGAGLDKFTETGRSGNTVVLTNTPDSVTEPGTPFSAGNMNHIEQGIFDAHTDIASEITARQSAVSAEASARQAAIAAEAQARQAAITAETQARQSAIAAFQGKQDEFQFMVNYLREVIEAKLGSINEVIPLAIEGGFYLATENGDYLVL